MRLRKARHQQSSSASVGFRFQRNSRGKCWLIHTYPILFLEYGKIIRREPLDKREATWRAGLTSAPWRGG